MNLEDQLQALIDSSPPHIQRHFACDCAERALKAAKVKDERSWAAVEVGSRYAEGAATSEELDAARDAAESAAWSAEWDKEREWQIEHLQSLITDYDRARSSLLYILQQRAEALRPTFTQYARTLEERVFE